MRLHHMERTKSRMFGNAVTLEIESWRFIRKELERTTS